MRRGLLGIGVGLLAVGAVSGCSYTPAGLEAWPEEPSCGRYENRNEPVSAEQLRKNQCLLDAAAAGRPAELVVTLAGDDGGPITEYYRVLGPRRIEGFIDTTQDPERVDDVDPHALRGGSRGGRAPLRVSAGCREIPIDEIVE